jgi:hypothetical protein
VDADDVIAPGYIGAMAAALERHDFLTSAFEQVALNADGFRADDVSGCALRSPPSRPYG